MTGEKIDYGEDALKMGKYWEGAVLNVPVKLPAAPSRPVQVCVTRKEIISVPGGYPWFMVRVSLSPRISIETAIQGIGFDVVARHPNDQLLQEVSPGKVWQFNGVMLPGQGLEIVCKVK